MYELIAYLIFLVVKGLPYLLIAVLLVIALWSVKRMDEEIEAYRIRKIKDLINKD